MGNSAGAVHAATWLLGPSLVESRKTVQTGSVIVKGVVLVSIPAHFHKAGADRMDVLTAYYKDRVEEDCALGQVSKAQSPEAKLLVVTATLDPEDEILEASQDFVYKYKEKFGQRSAEMDGTGLRFLSYSTHPRHIPSISFQRQFVIALYGRS
jgi:hypothetical protein